MNNVVKFRFQEKNGFEVLDRCFFTVDGNATYMSISDSILSFKAILVQLSSQSEIWNCIGLVSHV